MGDNTELNARLAELLAPLLEYAPLATNSVMEQFTGQTVQAMLEAEGWDSVGVLEAVVMEQLAANVRTVVSTLGGGGGAAARTACWRHFFGHLCVWIEEMAEPGATEVVQDRPQDDAYAQAEVQVKVMAGHDPAELALEALEQVLGGMKALLKAEDESPGMDLAGKKLLYIKLGARGWLPTLMPMLLPHSLSFIFWLWIPC